MQECEYLSHPVNLTGLHKCLFIIRLTIFTALKMYLKTVLWSKKWVKALSTWFIIATAQLTKILDGTYDQISDTTHPAFNNTQKKHISQI
jgi:hypothetical protein